MQVPILRRAALELVLAGRRFTAKSRAEDESLCQWGIIGTGYMGEQFSRYLDVTKAANIRAVYSRTAEKGSKFSKRHGAASTYSDLQVMLKNEKGKVDVIYIATPLPTHYEIAKECLRAGFNVLCEKPLCGTSVQAEELFSIARANDARLFEGMWSACLPTYRQADEWVSEGRIGDIRRIEASIRKEGQGNEKSCLFDFGSYAVSFALRFLGMSPLQINGFVRCDREGNDREWDIEIAGPTGVSAAVSLSTSGVGDSSATVIGNSGSVFIPAQFNRADSIELRDEKGEVVESQTFGYRCDGFEYEIADVMAAIKSGASSLLTEGGTLREIHVMEMLSGAKDGRFRFEAI